MDAFGCNSHALQAPKKNAKAPAGEGNTVSLGPQVAEGEQVFGVAHIFASFNDTFVHVTDLSGKETVARVTGAYILTLDGGLNLIVDG